MKLKNNLELTCRQYRNNDIDEIIKLIHRNFLEVNSKDYGLDRMLKLVESHDKKWFSQIASHSHVYVFTIENTIVGVGSISSFWGKVTESILLTIYVLPELHRNGIGSYIVDILEADEFFLRAERIEIPASITAVEFYRKKGYTYKNGIRALDDEGHYRLEKNRQFVDCVQQL